MEDEWWWIGVMARNPTARHRKGASAVESQCSYSYSIRIASSSSIHTAHTVPPIPRFLSLSHPAAITRSLPAKWRTSNSMRCGSLFEENRTAVLGRNGYGGMGKGGRAGGGWWGRGFGWRWEWSGLWWGGEKEKISGIWGCCESFGGETRRWEEIYKVLLRRVA